MTIPEWANGTAGPRQPGAPRTHRVDLPGRGTTRVWDCAGPPGAPTLMLIHGVAGTAELNWARVFAPLSRHFRVVAADLRGHGDGIRLRSRFRLEDCADDFAALAGVLGTGRVTAVGYSMGGLIAQLLYRRHTPLISGLVLCSTARGVRGSRAEELAARAVPVVAAALRWNPIMYQVSAEAFGMALLGDIGDPVTARWVRAQLRRTTLATAISALPAVSAFSSHGWIGQVDVPTAVVVTTRDSTVLPARQLELARAIPGASVYEVPAGHGACVSAPQLFAPALLKACRAVTSEHGRKVRAPA